MEQVFHTGSRGRLAAGCQTTRYTHCITQTAKNAQREPEDLHKWTSLFHTMPTQLFFTLSVNPGALPQLNANDSYQFSGSSLKHKERNDYTLTRRCIMSAPSQTPNIMSEWIILISILVVLSLLAKELCVLPLLYWEGNASAFNANANNYLGK